LRGRKRNFVLAARKGKDLSNKQRGENCLVLRMEEAMPAHNTTRTEVFAKFLRKSFFEK